MGARSGRKFILRPTRAFTPTKAKLLPPFNGVINAGASFAGALKGSTRKATSGAVNFAGSLTILPTAIRRTGNLSFTGFLERLRFKSYTGSASFAGSLTALPVITARITGPAVFRMISSPPGLGGSGATDVPVVVDGIDVSLYVDQILFTVSMGDVLPIVGTVGFKTGDLPIDPILIQGSGSYSWTWADFAAGS